MATSTTTTSYIQVIEDVIKKVREEFINNGGPGECILNEIQRGVLLVVGLKMVQVGVIVSLIDISMVAKSMTNGSVVTDIEAVIVEGWGGRWRGWKLEGVEDGGSVM
ncbi:hypothetical protein QVD17_41718 [Tagetes erecta]|uniref:Uncharacterized protein n=1 Tax=Tagetes erecta TaxID=13708 RepID=A0AAD8JPN7_TARER|nr:hypothetical protein QVD17_41718 [Tagetes erecta]